MTLHRWAFYAYDNDGGWDLVGYSPHEYGDLGWTRAWRIWRTYDATGREMPKHVRTGDLGGLGPVAHTS